MRIVGTGSAAPKNVITNHQLAQIMDTSDEWIRSRTGIEERHVARGETCLSLALDAAKAALKASGVPKERIGVVICATVSNEKRCPSLASCLQRDLGLSADILAFDLNAACSGFIYALICASHLISPDCYALIVGSEVLSRITDMNDRNTSVLFGDGAGAAIIAPQDMTQTVPFSWVTQSFGNDEVLYIDEHIHMNGASVFKFAVEKLVSNVRTVLERAQVALEDIDLLICHQANQRIIASAARQLGLPMERFFMNLARYGNTSAASVPIALDEAVRNGHVKRGANVIIAGFGGGLTVGAVYLQWA
ncbi:MAG: ketoacyl-ACP synthase III [Coriobacteriales bacterium]|jgi:3-oxoacyl-[acyl-carrier-protein] synthase-3|nr:ketoacyl-ACP synthase III [Coriobacteriales bacterium]